MQGIVSVLEDTTCQQVHNLWGELEADFGLRGVRTIFPHFTYQVVESYDLAQAEATLARVAQAGGEFHVTTSGLGIFTGERPVLYVPVVRSPMLNEFHRLLWEQLTPLASGVHAHYQPKNWVPHITLAIDDLEHDLLPEIIRRLSERSYSWEIAVNNVCVVYDSTTRENSWMRYDFSTGGRALVSR